MNESATIEITTLLVGKRFETFKDMAKAVQMDEESFQTLLGTFLNNGLITIIHVNAQGFEIFFNEQGPWMTSDEIVEVTGKTKNTVLRLARMMPPWMVQKKGNRYQFRSPSVEFIENYSAFRRGNQNKISPFLQLSPDAEKFWNKLPLKHQKKILKNAWCASCRGPRKMIKISGTCRRSGGLMLKGSCAVCKGKVANYIEPLKDRTR